MRILVAADLHNNKKFLDKLVSEANSSKYEIFIGCGDYDKKEFFRELIQKIKIKTICTSGNWEWFWELPDENLPNLYHFAKADIISKNKEKYRVILIGGTYPDDFQKQVRKWVKDFAKEKLIFATHYPPHLLRDLATKWYETHAGIPEFREMILKYKPALWLCGHIEEDAGVTKFLETTVVNAAVDDAKKAYSIEITNKGVQEVEEVDLS